MSNWPPEEDIVLQTNRSVFGCPVDSQQPCESDNDEASSTVTGCFALFLLSTG